MQNSISPKLTKLDLVTSTIVHEMGKVGVFHYCKLTYLFEYFFIKNFGRRYTNEYFVKLPHGPVISNYKKQISNLHKMSILSVDIDELTGTRAVDDYHESVIIGNTPKSVICLVPEKMVYSLILQTISKFGSLSVAELEKEVYKTPPVIKYLQAVDNGFKPFTGGYILKGDCLRMREFKNPKTKGRELALKHLQKYPTINFETQRKLAEELKDLEKLRPDA